MPTFGVRDKIPRLPIVKVSYIEVTANRDNILTCCSTNKILTKQVLIEFINVVTPLKMLLNPQCWIIILRCTKVFFLYP